MVKKTLMGGGVFDFPLTPALSRQGRGRPGVPVEVVCPFYRALPLSPRGRGAGVRGRFNERRSHRYRVTAAALLDISALGKAVGVRMAGKIFVNYRRGDARDGAARLRDKLAATLGDADVFMDVDNLLAGERFDLKLKEALAGTEVFLAVIGAHWMDLLEARKASEERDFVREEIAAALAAGIPVIPVTMDRAPLPKPASLPEDIRDLVLYHKHDVAYESFGRDVAALIEAIEAHRRARAEQKARLEAERLAREQAAAEAARRAAEQQRQESEAARLARERETAEAARLAYEKGRADAEAQRAKEKEQEQARRRARAPESAASGAGTPWKPVAAGLAAVAAIVLAIVYWPHTPAPVRAPDPTPTVRAEPEAACAGGGIRVSVGLSGAKTCVRPGSGKAFRDCPDCPEMVAVPAGSFLMGSPESEEGRFADESPQHKVTIAKPFAVGRTHVTRGQFAKFVEATGYRTDGGCWAWSGTEFKDDKNASWRSPGFDQSDDHPVVCINWDDATAYAAWLAKTTRQPYRLLTEAEAEYAARGVTKATPQPRYFFGNDESDLCKYANGADETAKAKFNWIGVAPCKDGHVFTAPVMSFKPNAFGLYDVHGNAWTWTQDCWVGDYKDAPDDGSARTTEGCPLRVLRGGSWGGDPRLLRAARRVRGSSGFRFNYAGFRVARTY